MDTRQRSQLISTVAIALSNKVRIGEPLRINMAQIAQISDAHWFEWAQIHRDIIRKKIVPWGHRAGVDRLEITLTCQHSSKIDDLEYPKLHARCHLCEIESFSLFSQLVQSPTIARIRAAPKNPAVLKKAHVPVLV